MLVRDTKSQASQAFVSVMLLSVSILVTRVTHADQLPNTEARARALHEAATKELEASGPTRACPMFEEVVSIAPESWGGWMMLGECRKREGKLASAFRAYSSASEIAKRLGHPGHAHQAAVKAAGLEPKMAKLVVELSDEVRLSPQLLVSFDGKPVEVTTPKTTLRVDKGDHVVVVEAKNKPRIEIHRSVLIDGAVANAQIDQWPAATKEKTESTSSTEVTISMRKKYVPMRWTWQRKAGVMTAGVGAAGLLAGSIAGAVAISRRDESNDGHCVNDVCDDQGLALRKGSLFAGNVSTGFFVVGGILTAAGATMFFVPWPEKQKVGFVVGPAQIGLRGNF